MSVDAPTKQDLTAVFAKLKAHTSNKACFDCGARNPSWVSATYGIFICIDCSAVHRSLGVHISFVRSSELDTKWNWTQLRSMQCGGNAAAHQFFNEHNCTTKDAQQKYSSRAAQLYRDKLAQTVANSLKMYGHCIDLPTPTPTPAAPAEPKPDFWSEHENQETTPISKSSLIGNYSKNSSAKNERTVGPNVSLATGHDSGAKEYKPSLIGNKKTAPKKGLGARKGLGAQKVQTDFNKLEEDAIKADELRDNLGKSDSKPLTEEDAQQQMESIRLAYQDLSEKQKQSEEKMRATDPNKANQMERLGMGFTSARTKANTVSHSAVSDMTTIEQIPNPNNSRNTRMKEMERELMMLELGFSSGPPKYKDTPFGKSEHKSKDDYDLDDFWSDLDKPVAKKPDILDSIETIDFEHSRSQDSMKKPKESQSSGASSRPSSSDSDAQKKFGNAKAISSDQYFGDRRNMDYEQRTTLNRFEGSNSISSDDFFGREQRQQPRSTLTNINTPNLYDIKEGVRDSVTQVAGRLSNLASNVMSSIQEKYGGY